MTYTFSHRQQSTRKLVQTVWLMMIVSFLLCGAGVEDAGAQCDPEQTFKLLPADGAASDYFGYSRAVDGTTAVVGSPYDDDNGSSYVSSWSQSFPSLGSLIGANTFQLEAEDVTPAPFNQPPYPAAGDMASASCIVTANAP